MCCHLVDSALDGWTCSFNQTKKKKNIKWDHERTLFPKGSNKLTVRSYIWPFQSPIFHTVIMHSVLCLWTSQKGLKSYDRWNLLHIRIRRRREEYSSAWTKNQHQVALILALWLWLINSWRKSSLYKQLPNITLFIFTPNTYMVSFQYRLTYVADD